jgi:putative tricarboxylic transport membrane protein
MKLVFLVVLWLAGAAYAYWGLSSLSIFIRGGRIGPGFFPAAISALFLATTTIAILAEGLALGRAGRLRLATLVPPFERDLVVLLLLTFAFGLGLTHVGVYVPVFVFLLLSLGYFNPGRHVANVAMAIAVPVTIGLFFELWFGASLPRGILF